MTIVNISTSLNPTSVGGVVVDIDIVDNLLRIAPNLVPVSVSMVPLKIK